LLRGDEIVATLENPWVAYGWRPGSENEGSGNMHVDVFSRDRDVPRAERPFKEGWYNGGRNSFTALDAPGADPVLRRRYRDIDAADYF